ncbi:nuclear transport factor 2 family protein [Mesonia aestuariivivens]|uniref:Nuclear transport factor 2 family protein n=1 Tax=Mesonia aestuariivivens TaxID=2796128 RepID=A0ABS6W3R7_9FLAO|nr:nuclear transport factor 2 family protein [Mesonia aestuariivivens]MBW2962510.1 nuclear transport factor 2 family protein [Mesonia aestuariivivens]
MRFLYFFIMFSFAFTGFSQTKEESANTMVKEFFKAFNQQDSVKLKSFAFEEVELKSIVKNDQGKMVVHTDTYDNFISNIVNIPREVNFEERLGIVEIKTDGYLASVWVPYEFYLNEELSHCGVNIFQLIYTQKGWKIISLFDTRKKQACKY